ncbi:MAG: hypothetical protein AMXMBFR33_01530 [Candidatus Xenobia bacterium]
MKTNDALAQLGSEFKSVQTALKEELKKQNEEIKKLGGTTSSTSKSIAALEERYNKTAEDIQSEIKRAHETAVEQKSRLDDIEAKLNRTVVHGDGQTKSIGKRLTESETYRKFLENKSAVSMEPVKLGRIWPEKKALDPGDARDVLSTMLDQRIYAPPRLRQMHLRDVLNVVRTTKAQLEFVVETGYTNAAAERAEGAEAALSEISFDKSSVASTQVSHGLVLTKEQARDMPTVENFTENRMVNGIYHKEDTLLIAGSSASLKGFTQVSGRQTYNRHQAGDTKIDALRRAQTMLHLVELPTLPTVYIVNHEDWEEMELQKDSQDRYIWAQVQVNGQKVMWQVPVFPTSAIDQGQFVTGDLYQSSTFYDLEEVSVQIFNQHSDFALSGKLLLFGDEGVYIAHQIPELIITGSYTGSGS